MKCSTRLYTRYPEGPEINIASGGGYLMSHRGSHDLIRRDQSVLSVEYYLVVIDREGHGYREFESNPSELKNGFVPGSGDW